MEKAAVLADSRLFLPASPRDACVQEQAVLLFSTTQQPTKNKQLIKSTTTTTYDFNY
jgi:hypothetical protein